MSFAPTLTAAQQARLVSMGRLAAQPTLQARLEGLEWMLQHSDPSDLALFYNLIVPHWSSFSDAEKVLYLEIYQKAAQAQGVGAAFDGTQDAPPVQRNDAPEVGTGNVNLSFDLMGTLTVNGQPFTGIKPQGVTLEQYLAKLPKKAVLAQLGVSVPSGEERIWEKTKTELQDSVPFWLFDDSQQTRTWISLHDLAKAREWEHRFEKAFTNVYRLHGGNGNVTLKLNIERGLFDWSGDVINRGVESWLEAWEDRKQDARDAKNAIKRGLNNAGNALNNFGSGLKKWVPVLLVGGAVVWVGSYALTAYAVGRGLKSGLGLNR